MSSANGWLACLASLCAVMVLPAAGQAQTRSGLKLVWSDEFNRAGHPDPTKWDYEVGFVRNHEVQYYTRDRLENASVADGHLTIEARKEAYQNASVTSASLTSR